MRKLLLVLGFGLVLTSCEKEALDDWAAGYDEETNTIEEEEGVNIIEVNGATYYVDSCLMSKRDDDTYGNKCAHRSVKVFTRNGSCFSFYIYQYNRNEENGSNYGGTYSLNNATNMVMAIHGDMIPEWYEEVYYNTAITSESDNGRLIARCLEPYLVKFEGECMIKGKDSEPNIYIEFNVNITNITTKDHNLLYPDYAGCSI